MSDTDFLSTKSQRKVISLSRRAFNENDFKSCYAHSKSARQQTPLWQKGRNHLRRYFRSLTCKSLIYSWFPIVSWLPKYKIKDYLVPDIMGGFTVSILHIPQGLAYALLASVPPIGGLYLAVIPLLVYTIFGTSRHLSLGTFAVVCLMVGSVVEREIARIEPATTQSSILATTSPPISGGFLNTTTLNKLIRKEESNSTYPSDEEIMDKKKMEIAVTLALLVGIVQFLMGLLKLGFVAVYLSDPLISGFTTGAAILVLTSQVKNIFGISVPRYTGAFATVKTYIYMFEHITETVPGSLITGVVCIILVYCLKLLDEKTRKYIKFPIPADLIAVILGTGITYGAETHKKYDVAVLGEIPKGFPPFSTPSLPLMETMIVDAIVIAIVVFATNVSLAKMFAQKNKYTIDPNQELIAYGAGNVIGSFFSCFPVSGSLSRSAVQESQAKSLLCNVPVVGVIILVLLFLAPLFYCLPKAVLAGVILVALKGLLQQFKRLKELWIICKPDAVVWLVTWSGVVFLGIDTGLAIGIVVALLMVIIRSARPRYQILGQVPGTEIYRDIRQFPGAEEIPGIKIFRFESAVFYANAEYFRNALIQKIGMDPLVVNRHMMGSSQTLNKPSSPQNHEKADSSETVVTFRKKSGDDAVNILPENTVTPSIPNGDAQIENGTDLSDVEPEVKPGKIHTIIIDGSTFNFIDTQGVNTLIKLAKEFQRINVNFYLASCRHSIRDMLDKAHFTRDVGSHHLFISVHDAVIHALMPEQEVLSLASQASLENIDNAQPSLPRPLRSPTNLAYNSTERQKLLANSADQEVFKESSSLDTQM